MFGLRCRGCEARDKEIAYLRSVIDNLLLKNGIRPVAPVVVDEEETDAEKKARADKESGAIRYGE